MLLNKVKEIGIIANVGVCMDTRLSIKQKTIWYLEDLVNYEIPNLNFSGNKNRRHRDATK